MAKYIEQHIPHYYDLTPTPEDLMGTHFLHEQLVEYLKGVLKWLMRGQTSALYSNLNFYHTIQWLEYPLVPDIALIKGVEQQVVSSWNIGITGPAPQVVFEMASERTWERDLDEKPAQYALVEVDEYYAYDSHTPLFRTGTTNRLYGWHLNKATGHMQAMPFAPDGSLWSPHLDSFLVPDGEYLRLYDDKWQLRLTGEEAQEQAKLAEARRADAEAQAKWAEARRADREKKRAEEATRRADAEAQAKQAETRRADEEKSRADALAEKLRSLGIDPNQL